MSRRKKSKYDKYFSTRTHSSITAFSKNAGGSTKRRKSYTEKRRNRIAMIVGASILGAVVIFTAAFFITDTLIGISNANVEQEEVKPGKKPNTENKGDNKPAAQQIQPSKTKADINSIKAITIDESLLSNSSALDAQIKNIKASKVNTVIIDFKDENGFVYYKSAFEKLKDSPILSKAQVNADAAVKKLQSAGINVAARIYCFKDPMMARQDRNTAALYSNTKSLWLDNDPKKGGKPWLNPYSKEATDYLIFVVSEVKALGVDYIMLDGVQFPNLYSPITTFRGEKESGAESRNKILINFVNSCVKASGDTPVIVCMNGETAVIGKSMIYGDGSLFASNADAFAVDVRTLKKDAEKKYPSGKKVIEIKASAQNADKTFIISK